ncbi:Cdc37 N terminal kinase binding-domain-containing protein [Amylostereum chailletii]|nr:Cdc37 N terminal kinase binding-domain-containing protein [Amylostereum chailletii]
MPLNYSKWDQLELSDDSDIEGHPNVDHKSLVRWKQRDIHEKREARNLQIQALSAEIECNKVLLARIKTFHDALSSSDAVPISDVPIPKRFSNEVERLRTQPSPEAPPSNAAQPVPYDTMILKLLEAVAGEARDATGTGADEDKLATALVERLAHHVKKLGEVIAERQTELDELNKEKNKHITSDDMHEGWESKYVPAKPEPPPVVKPSKSKGKGKAKATEIEVLNPSSSSAVSTPAPDPSSDTDDPDDELPIMTPTLQEFSRLPLWGFEESWKFIQDHRDVVVPGASDALLVAAFNAQTEGKSKLAKQCIHQSLLLQYGDRLGKDGLKLFFQRMIAGGQKVHAIFRKDVEDTYAHVVKRVEVTAAESAAAGSGEQIQLVAENPDTEISFNVPDGPPPEHITLEGPGTEDLDIDEVRRVLQMRWDVFCGLSEPMQVALKTGELAKVNSVLGSMDVSEAEQVVQMLDMGGILSFAEGGVRDVTGKGDEADDEGDDADEA